MLKRIFAAVTATLLALAVSGGVGLFAHPQGKDATPAGADQAIPGKGSAGLAWAKDLDAALATAKKQDKLVFVAASYGLCGWCRKMDQEVYADPKVKAAMKNYVPVHEKAGLGMKDGKHVMYDSAFLRKQKTAFTPTFYILDPPGKVIDTFVSYHAVPELVARLAQAERDYRAFPRLAKHLKADAKDYAAAGRYAAMLAARGRLAEALALVKDVERAGAQAQAALAPAYNRIADAHYQALFGGACELYGSFAAYDKSAVEASRWFKKTVEGSRDPALLAYARYGLATCSGAAGKRAEQNALHAQILAMPDAPAMIKGWVKQRRPAKGKP